MPSYYISLPSQPLDDAARESERRQLPDHEVHGGNRLQRLGALQRAEVGILQPTRPGRHARHHPASGQRLPPRCAKPRRPFFSPTSSTPRTTVTTTKNDAYFRDEQRGYREYETVPGTHEDAENGSYRVTENTEERTVTFQVPLYTRAKQLIPRSGHTGNNPFVAYRRRATVKFTAELTDDEGHTNTIVERAPILQVRRVVNPKGIWRKHDSTNPFHVVLKHLSEESSQEFKTFTSEGTWRAYVVRGDKDLVTLDGKSRPAVRPVRPSTSGSVSTAPATRTSRAAPSSASNTTTTAATT